MIEYLHSGLPVGGPIYVKKGDIFKIIVESGDEIRIIAKAEIPFDGTYDQVMLSTPKPDENTFFYK